MTAQPTDLALKRPAQVTTVPPASTDVREPGRWLPAILLFGFPILFITMFAFGFIAAR
jgi:hypothetical protein